MYRQLVDRRKEGCVRIASRKKGLSNNSEPDVFELGFDRF